MKKIYHLAILCAVPLLFACKGSKDVDEPEVDPAPQPQTIELTFVLPEEGGKTAWVAGDEIIVHGEYAADQVKVTLAASDISSGGKTATKTVEGLFPYVREDCTSSLYAAYPAEAVDNLTHCFFYSKFSTTNKQIMAACNDASNRFVFEDICGLLSFDLTEEYDSYSITAAKKESLGYEFLQVKLTDKDKNFTQYKGDPVITLEGDASSSNMIFVPDGTELKAGFTIKFKKDGIFVKCFRSTDPIKIGRGEIVDLGDITSKLEDYDDPFSSDILDLDDKGNANCYIIQEPGKYKFKAVKGNKSTAYVEDVFDAKVVWETWNNAEEVTAGSIIADVSYAEDYMILHTPDVLTPGNALIAAVDSDGVIVWSWHIWIPETPIVTEDYGVLPSAMMDRNLGALVAATIDGPAPIESFGLTYQWGRKDPFPGPSAPKSSSNATVAGTAVTQTPGAGEGNECKISLEESIANPTVLGHSMNGDWLLPPGDSSLWTDSEKTIYDPCPPGYRVPARNSSYPFHSGDLTAQTGWQENVDNYWFTLGSPAGVFPLAGYRDDYAPGSMTHAYDRAVYWTAYASADGVTGYYLNVRSPGSAHKLAEAGKSRAGSVRCVVE